ncbi:hypothetical protein [Nitrosomonas eutropha]|uniref:hypothetical protein n=1 Tax=Nitrosomonas eutropha TaxID=916 RepID=UPI0002E796F5|nr:hypothetical protein [Nitrosomonas eutropha]
MGCIPPDDRPTKAEGWKEWCDSGFERAIRVALSRGIGLKTISRNTEEAVFRIVLKQVNGNTQQAAQLLGVTDRTIQNRKKDRSSTGKAGNPL